MAAILKILILYKHYLYLLLHRHVLPTIVDRVLFFAICPVLQTLYFVFRIVSKNMKKVGGFFNCVLYSR